MSQQTLRRLGDRNTYMQALETMGVLRSDRPMRIANSMDCVRRQHSAHLTIGACSPKAVEPPTGTENSFRCSAPERLMAFSLLWPGAT